MIKKVDSRSSIEDVSTTTTSIVNDFSQRDHTCDPYLTAQTNQLINYNRLLTQAIKETAAGSILFPIDSKRDGTVRVIFYENKAKLHWPDENISGAAQIVMNELDKYGLETIKMSYSSESANINALLEDFKKPEVAAAIQVLPGMQSLVDQLKIDQKEFETSYLVHVGQKIENQELLSATKLRFIIRDIINKHIVVYLNAMSQALPDEYKECADVVATIIEENNQLVRNRYNKVTETPDVNAN